METKLYTLLAVGLGIHLAAMVLKDTLDEWFHTESPEELHSFFRGCFTCFMYNIGVVEGIFYGVFITLMVKSIIG